MKKVRLSALIAVAIVTFLAACGGEKKVENEAPVEEAAPVEVVEEAATEAPVEAEATDSVATEEAPVEEAAAEEAAPVEEVKEAAPVAKPEAKVEKTETKSTEQSISLGNVVKKAEEIVEGSPAIKFAESEYNFGEINQGDKVSYTFNFTNTGDAPLIISNARASCGCTVPKWPREPIAPGETSKIDVVFNSAGKRGRQTKSITITTNIKDKPQQQVFLKGMVNVPQAPAAE